jgi:hypothetical protein
MMKHLLVIIPIALAKIDLSEYRTIGTSAKTSLDALQANSRVTTKLLGLKYWATVVERSMDPCMILRGLTYFRNDRITVSDDKFANLLTSLISKAADNPCKLTHGDKALIARFEAYNPVAQRTNQDGT